MLPVVSAEIDISVLQVTIMYHALIAVVQGRNAYNNKTSFDS